MNGKIEYEKAKVSIEYLGKQYLGEIVCSENESKTYWFVFDQIDVKPFGGSVKFRIVNSQLETAEDFKEYALFVLCIKTAIEKYRKELCN